MRKAKMKCRHKGLTGIAWLRGGTVKACGCGERFRVYCGKWVSYPKTPPFRPGDRVTTTFVPEEKDIIRVVTDCWETPSSQSGWNVSTGQGGSCEACKRPFSIVSAVDSDWFERVK